MRVTKSDLYRLIDILNNESKKNYGLDIAYGGYKLVRKYKNGAKKDISLRVTCREMYYVLNALVNYACEEKYGRSDDD